MPVLAGPMRQTFSAARIQFKAVMRSKAVRDTEGRCEGDVELVQMLAPRRPTNLSRIEPCRGVGLFAGHELRLNQSAHQILRRPALGRGGLADRGDAVVDRGL